MKAIETAVSLAKRFEGFYPNPYLCPAGVPTIGFGATFYEDGSRVTLADPAITLHRAEELLLFELERHCLPAVMKLCPVIDTDDRLAAIIDFTFNLGSGRLKASTLRRRINDGDWDAVPAELLKWNKGGGRVLKGLTLRRQAEAALV